MRICILTTETLHHAHYVRHLAVEVPDILVLCETRGLPHPYETAHPFEAAREVYERALWFGSGPANLADLAPTEAFPTLNAEAPRERIRRFEPDLIVSFGVGRLDGDMIALGGNRLLNLHGGDPESYRGLDTHLWAIWHRDFGALVTTVHRVSPGLDEGEIVGIQPVPIAPGLQLHQLRAANTETCIALTRLAIDQLGEGGAILSRPQRSAGRYYSAMPTALKEVCVGRFSRWTERLPR
jgi:hypothetical protein